MNREQVSIKTPEFVSLRFQSANLGSRAVAFIIDNIIINVVQIIIGILGLVAIGGFDGLLAMAESSLVIVAIVIILFFIVYYGYFFIFEYFNSGRTPGKRAIGIRVIQENGHSVTLLSSLVRNLLRLIDSMPTGYFVGILMVYFHPKNKRLGDLVAGTIVVHERPGKGKRLTKFERYIQSRNLPLAEITIDEVTMRSIGSKEWNLLKTYSERLLSLSFDERNRLTEQMADVLFDKFRIDKRGKTRSNLEDILLTLYLLLKEEWDFE